MNYPITTVQSNNGWSLCSNEALLTTGYIITQ